MDSGPTGLQLGQHGHVLASARPSQVVGDGEGAGLRFDAVIWTLRGIVTPDKLAQLGPVEGPLRLSRGECGHGHDVLLAQGADRHQFVAVEGPSFVEERHCGNSRSAAA